MCLKSASSVACYMLHVKCSYRSASSRMSQRTALKAMLRVCLIWSTRRPGVDTRMLIPLRSLRTEIRQFVLQQDWTSGSVLLHRWWHVFLLTNLIIESRFGQKLLLKVNVMISRGSTLDCSMSPCFLQQEARGGGGGEEREEEKKEEKK